METNPTRRLLDRFSEAIEAEGIEAVPADVMISFVEVARSVDASPVAIGVLADPTEPTVARERAFCKLSIQVVGREDRLAAPRTLSGIVWPSPRTLLPA